MHLRRPLRRTLALAAGAVVLTVPLSSCGFDYATDRVYTPAAGTNARGEDNVDVLNATVVAAREGSGTLSAGIANGTDEELALTAVTSTGADVEAEVGDVTVPANGFLDLGAEGTVLVSGEVAAGDVLPLTLEFDNGVSVDIDVPVVTNCDEFEGVDTSEGSGEEYSCETAEPAGGEH